MCGGARFAVCVCVCVCACVRACVRACVYALRIVSMDKILPLQILELLTIMFNFFEICFLLFNTSSRPSNGQHYTASVTSRCIPSRRTLGHKDCGLWTLPREPVWPSGKAVGW